MKTIFAVIGVVLLVGAGVFAGMVLGKQEVVDVAWRDEPLKKVKKLTLVEMTRNWSHTVKDDKGAGVGIIEYHWGWTFAFGIDVPPDWDWQIAREDGVVSVRAPKLTLLQQPKFAIDDRRVLNKASGKRLLRMDSTAKDVAESEFDAAERSLPKKGGLVYEHAQLSLQEFLLNLLNQANPENRSHKLTVTFAK